MMPTSDKILHYLRRNDGLLAQDGTSRLSHKAAEQALRDVYLLACGKQPQFYSERMTGYEEPIELEEPTQPQAAEPAPVANGPTETEAALRELNARYRMALESIMVMNDSKGQTWRTARAAVQGEP